MDIVLGVSVTNTTVRMVLIEGEKADGVTVESEAFDTAAAEGAAKPSPSEQVSTAILATQQNALSIGHHLVVSGVTWVDLADSDLLRDSIAGRGIDNVVLVSEHSAAGALCQVVGRALGYDTTAFMLIKPDSATLSIVDSADGSIVEARACSLDGVDATDVMPEMVAGLESANPHPQGVFVVGSGVDVRSIRSTLECCVSQPVIVPEEPELALARGAALAAATVPGSEGWTSALAYAQDPDGIGALGGSPLKLSDADTEVAVFGYIDTDDAEESADLADRLKVILSVGSVVAAILVIGVVALVMSLAVSIRPTVDKSLEPSEKAIVPSAVVTAPPVAQGPAVVQSPAAVPPAKPPGPTIPDASVVAQPPVPPPVQEPAVQASAPAPAAQQPAPSRVVTAPTPVAVEKPLAAAPVAVEPAPAQDAPVPAAIPAPPEPLAPPPAAAAAPSGPAPQAPVWPWRVPTLRIGPLQIPLGPPPQVAPQPPLWTPPQAPLWTPPQAPQWTPPQAPQWTPPQAPQWTPPQAPQWTPPQAPQWTPPQAPAQLAPSPPPPRLPWQPPFGSSSGPRSGPGQVPWWPFD